MLGIVHDENAFHIQLHATLGIAVEHIERRFRGQIQKLGVFVLAFDLRVRPGQRLFPIVRNVFIKFLVFRFGDVALATRPQGTRLVDGLEFILDHVRLLVLVPFGFLHHDGHLDVIGIFADNRFQTPVVEKLLGILLQM